MHLREREQAVARRRQKREVSPPAPQADLRQLAGNRAVATLMREPEPGVLGLDDARDRIAALRRMVAAHKAKPGKQNLVEQLTNEAEMLLLQQQMQKYNRLMTMLSNLLQMQHETRKALVQNLRA